MPTESTDLRVQLADARAANAALTGRLSVMEAGLVAAREALREIHEFHCGCDRPGNPASCVCEPREEFTLLAALAPEAERTEQ